jgi:tetratricopeptide (TPR) repeat protein
VPPVQEPGSAAPKAAPKVERALATWEAAYGAAVSKLAQGDFPGAIAEATQAIEANPRATDAWSIRGEAKARSGDIEGGLRDLDAALRLDPDHVPSLRRRALVQTLLGRPEGVGDARRVLELAPTAENYDWHATFALRFDERLASKEYAKAIELAGDRFVPHETWTLPHPRQSACRARGWIARADALVRQQGVGGARWRLYQRALDLDPTVLDGERLRWLWLALGLEIECTLQNELHLGIELNRVPSYSRAIAGVGDSPLAARLHEARAFAYDEKDDFGHARADLAMAEALSPRDTEGQDRVRFVIRLFELKHPGFKNK